MKRSQFDWDGKYCPDCGGKCLKKLLKWPHPFECHVCTDCEMDWFPCELNILPQKPVAIGLDKKGKLEFRVVKDTSRNYNPPKLTKKIEDFNNEA
jgi:hypothetical protein